MKQPVWAAVGRWLLVLPVFLLGFAVAYIALMFSILLDQSCLGWAQALKLSVPPSVLLRIVDVVIFVATLTIWIAPTVFAIGFALRIPKADRVQWSLTLALLLGAAYVWARGQAGFDSMVRIAAVSAVAILVCVVALSFRWAHRVRAHFLANTAAFAILILPSFVELAAAPKQPPNARRIWSAVLEKGTWQAMNTGYSSSNHVAFAGDRVLAIFDAGSAGYQGKEPMSNYRLVSMSVTTGEVKNTSEFVGLWGAGPRLFATKDGSVILANATVKSSDPDHPGPFVVDSHTLALIQQHVAVSVTPSPKKQNHDSRFPGDCGVESQLNENTAILVGCGKIRTMNLQGTALKESNISGPANFAGSSQDGRRFALQFSDERGDFSVVLYEYFIIFDVATLQPVAKVPISDLPEHQSWSAFSPDGQYFIAGNPNVLSLYQFQ